MKMTLIVLGTVAGIFLLFSPIVWAENASNNRLIERATKVSNCRLAHSSEIMTFVKECVASLKVEENAYVVDSCEGVAVRNLCSAL